MAELLRWINQVFAAVVTRTLFRVGQCLVGFTNVLESLCRSLVTLVLSSTC
jgi:hypothetical protein